MPAAAHVEKEGTFTNTQRLRAVARQGARPAGRRALGAVVHAPPRSSACKAHYADSDARARLADPQPHLGLPRARPAARARRRGRCCKEINGYDVATGEPLSRLRASSKDDGSTACGCWIYSGVLRRRRQPGAPARPGRPRRPRAAGSRPSGAGRGRPTAACSTTARRPTREGKPWSERKKYVWWDEEQEQWTGYDVPDFPADKRPDYRRAGRRRGHGRDLRRRPVHHDGRRPRPGCTRRAACSTAPLPTHYEPLESPVDNALYPEVGANPVGARAGTRPENPLQRRRRPALPARRHDVPAHRAPHRRAR